jgi:hypothetical protein
MEIKNAPAIFTGLFRGAEGKGPNGGTGVYAGILQSYCNTLSAEFAFNSGGE